MAISSLYGYHIRVQVIQLLWGSGSFVLAHFAAGAAILSRVAGDSIPVPRLALTPNLLMVVGRFPMGSARMLRMIRVSVFTVGCTPPACVAS